jgi:hypothetical protein
MILSHPLLFDLISCSHVGIKQVQFGGLEFENWDDELKTEEAGYSVHKI